MTSSGKLTSTFFRLFCLAPRIFSHFPLGCLRPEGTGICSVPTDTGRLWNGIGHDLPGVPVATISSSVNTLHPDRYLSDSRRPAWYPRHALPRSGIAQVPQVFQRFDQPFIVPLVQADAGLGQIYKTPISPDPIWVARRMRWASPEREPAERDRVR